MAEYRLFASMHEDIAEGFVWLKDEKLPPRCIVRISRTDGRRRAVFCEALQFDKNFLKRYNQPSRCKIKDDDSTLASSMVMSHWYRAKLGHPGPALETGKGCGLDVVAFDHVWSIHNRWWGKLRACMGHPQVVVRVAVKLAVLSVVLGGLGLFGVTIFGRVTVPGLVGDVAHFVRPAKETAMTPSALSVDGVLGWRDVYGDLLGKPREAIVERFGSPKEEDASFLTWGAAPRTGNRLLMMSFDSANVAASLKVHARANERLDVMAVLQKAHMFTFSTGVYSDTVLDFIAATTLDGRNSLQFELTEGGPKFSSILLRR